MTVTIERLTPEQASLAVELLLSFGEERTSLETVRAFLERPGHYLLVAYLAGAPSGWLLAYEQGFPHRPGRKIFVYSVDVLEQARRQGVGRALLGAIVGLARREGMMSTWLLCDRANEGAAAFYRRCGGRLEGPGELQFVWT